MEESKTVIRNNSNFQARDLRLVRDCSTKEVQSKGGFRQMPEEGDDVLVLL